MPGSSHLFDRLSDVHTLEQAWDRVRRNGGGAGGDGVTLRDYAEDLPVRLLRLNRDLRNGTYAPGPLRRLLVPKRSGGQRPLAIPCVEDRIAQTAANLILGPMIDDELEESSFAYRPGRGVRRAVDRVMSLRRQGYTWVVDGDIERYFDSVPHDRLLARLERSVDDPLVVDLVAQWLDAFSNTGTGLPQGAPISPLLSNLYLDDVDERIAGRGVHLVRFADDFVLLCRGEDAAEEALRRMRDLLAEHGLRLHPDKTRVVAFEKGFRFLGHLFVKSLALKDMDAPGHDLPANAAQAVEALAEPPPDDLAPLDEADGAPALRLLYVMEPGRRLSVNNKSFVVTEDGAPLVALPAARVDRIELGPAAEADADAVRHAAATGTALAFVDGWGRTTATLGARPWDHAGLHADQARVMGAPDLRLDLARRFVDGRLRNQRALLRRLNRRRKDPELDAPLAEINRLLRKLPLAEDVPALMGLEGRAAALYWPALGRMLAHGWTFQHRHRRPPPDPVNLALSFLASLLGRDLEALTARVGLHPGFGMLHSPRDDARACVYDLMEEFRAPLVEGLVVYLFNNRILTAEMFSTPETGACYVDPAGRRALIRGWEAWVDRPVKSPRTGHSIPWRRLMTEQAHALVRHLREEEDYRPYVMDY